MSCTRPDGVEPGDVRRFETVERPVAERTILWVRARHKAQGTRRLLEYWMTGNLRRRAVATVLQITGDTRAADGARTERGRLKPRLKGLRPQNLPVQVSRNRLPDAPLAHVLQPAEAGFAAQPCRRGFSRQPSRMSLLIWKTASRLGLPTTISTCGMGRHSPRRTLN